MGILQKFPLNETSWQKSSFPMKMDERELHIWKINLDVYPSEFNREMLDEDELQKAGRFIYEIHRRRYLLAHFYLRKILADYLQTSLAEIVFYKNENGKPYIQSQIDLHFNLSHSEDVGLIAVTERREIGIDIEKIKDGMDVLAIAARFFAKDEYQFLKSLPEKQQLDKFYELWVGKEAYIKAIGVGLTHSLSQFSALNNPAVHALAVEPGYKAAVALSIPESWSSFKMSFFRY